MTTTSIADGDSDRADENVDPSRVVNLAEAFGEAVRVGPFDVPQIGAVVIAAALGTATSIGLAYAGAGQLIGGLTALAVFTLVGTETYYHLVPRRVRRAMAAHAYVGSWEMKRLRALAGSVPTSPDAATEWLERHPETDANRWARAELLAWTGDLDGAQATIERMPADTDEERFDRHVLDALLDIVRGRPADLDLLDREAETVGRPESEVRLRAIATAAITRARQERARGGDWMTPLVEAQRRIGPRSLSIVRADTWRGRFTVFAVISAVFAIISAVLA